MIWKWCIGNDWGDYGCVFGDVEEDWIVWFVGNSCYGWGRYYDLGFCEVLIEW